MKKLVAPAWLTLLTSILAGVGTREASASGQEPMLLPAWTISRPGPAEGTRVFLGHAQGQSKDTKSVYLMFERNGVRVVVDRDLAAYLGTNPQALDVRWTEPDRITVSKGEEPALHFAVSTLEWQPAASKQPKADAPE